MGNPYQDLDFDDSAMRIAAAIEAKTSREPRVGLFGLGMSFAYDWLAESVGGEAGMGDEPTRGPLSALRGAAMMECFAALGAEPVGNRPEEFRSHIRAKLQETAKIVKYSGMKIE